MEYSNITIKKAKIKSDLFLEVEYSEQTPDGANSVKKDCTAVIHDDLKAAYAALDEHLGELTEQFSGNKKGEYADVKCKGFTLGGSGDNQGFVLSGARSLEEGKILNVTSPFFKFDEVPGDIEDLLQSCRNEICMYLFEGKHKPDAQQAIPFPELEEENA